MSAGWLIEITYVSAFLTKSTMVISSCGNAEILVYRLPYTSNRDMTAIGTIKVLVLYPGEKLQNSITFFTGSLAVRQLIYYSRRGPEEYGNKYLISSLLGCKSKTWNSFTDLL